MEKEAKRVLLVGKDSIFAWAVEQSVSSMGYQLEHVFTVAEARLRLSRFSYAAVLADGIDRRDVDLLIQECRSDSAMFVFDDINLEAPPEVHVGAVAPGATVIAKETALPKIVSTLKNRN